MKLMVEQRFRIGDVLDDQDMFSDELTTEIKVILENLRAAGCSISRKVVISVGNQMESYRRNARRKWGKMEEK